MLTENEQRFLEYWEQNRLREKSWKYQLLTGLPWGLLFATPILVLLMTAKLWYVRAEMEANTMVNPIILIIAVIVIATFVAFFYKSHKWEMKDRLYQSLKAREKQENTPHSGA